MDKYLYFRYIYVYEHIRYVCICMVFWDVNHPNWCMILMDFVHHHHHLRFHVKLSDLNCLEALAWYLRAAKQSHTAAMLQLGALLHDGDRLHLENTSGRLEKSPVVWVDFGFCLALQMIIPKFIFIQARFMQEWHEMHQLMLLLLSLYVERDSLTAAVSLYERNASSAFQWYLEAAKRGSATGQFLVGLAYSNGVAWRVGNSKFLLDLARCGY